MDISEKKESKNAHTRQHIIPETYLKNWMNSNNHLWVYDKEKKLIRQISHKEFRRNHFYSYKESLTSKYKTTFETEMSKIERYYPQIIKKIDRKLQLDVNELEKLNLFISLLQCRTQIHRIRHIEPIIKKFLNDCIKKDEMYIKNNLMSYNIELEDSDLQKFITLARQADDINEILSSSYFIQTLYLLFLINEVMSFKYLNIEQDWFLYKAPEETSFITSDYPFYPIIYDFKETINFKEDENFRCFPLSPRTLIAIAPPTRLKGNIAYGKITKKEVRYVNVEFLKRSERYAIAKDKDLLENLKKYL